MPSPGGARRQAASCFAPDPVSPAERRPNGARPDRDQSNHNTDAGITRLTRTGTGPRIAPRGSTVNSSDATRLSASMAMTQRRAQRRCRRTLRASQNIPIAIRMVIRLSTRKPGSTMANGIALNPATSERLACVTTSTEAISVALVVDGTVVALTAGDVMLIVWSTPLQLLLDGRVEVRGKRSLLSVVDDPHVQHRRRRDAGRTYRAGPEGRLEAEFEAEGGEADALVLVPLRQRPARVGGPRAGALSLGPGADQLQSVCRLRVDEGLRMVGIEDGVRVREFSKWRSGS